MLRLLNKTPFAVDWAPSRTEDGAEVFVVAIKGTFTLCETPELAAEQPPLNHAYAFLGDPAHASLQAIPELVLPTGGTDVALLGEAWAPNGRPMTRLDVSLTVAGRVHVVRVEGDRVWRSYTLGISSPPIPFTRMPLIYERAFGGSPVDELGRQTSAPFNPIGVGWRGSRTRRTMRGTPLPNLRDPRLSARSPEVDAPPAGFGWVAPHWLPRRTYAGTYDAAWKASRAPFLPADFDRRFHRAAPAALHFSTPLRGGEAVLLQCLAQQSWLPLRLPDYRLSLQLKGGTGRLASPPELSLEGVCFEPERGTFCMLWRAEVPHAPGAVEAVRVGLT